MSQRRACEIVGQHRSTQRYEPAEPDPDRSLRAELRGFAESHPRWGYRRAHAVLQRQGWAVNRKKVQRLWRQEGLRVPPKRRKRQRLGDSDTDAGLLRAQRPDHVWALDFQFDVTASGPKIKILHVLDEFTRESLADLTRPARATGRRSHPRHRKHPPDPAAARLSSGPSHRQPAGHRPYPQPSRRVAALPFGQLAAPDHRPRRRVAGRRPARPVHRALVRR